MSLPEPYYEEPGITIYHGDCREILPHLPKVDLVLTDPPYNAGKDYGVWDDSLPVKEYEAAMALIVGKCRRLALNQAWVAPRYQLRFWMSILPDAHLVVVKRGAQGPFRGNGWCDQFEVVLVEGRTQKPTPDLWEGIRLKGEGYFFREDTFGHPGYTPMPIIRRLLTVLPSESVLDPFMGSGTTLVAAKQLGRKAIGVEISEDYCRIAAERLRGTTPPLPMEPESQHPQPRGLWE